MTSFLPCWNRKSFQTAATTVQRWRRFDKLLYQHHHQKSTTTRVRAVSFRHICMNNTSIQQQQARHLAIVLASLQQTFPSSSSSSSPSQHRQLSTSSSPDKNTKPILPNDYPKLENTIHKVLIANRGEIACRIIRTCHSLQIPTVAIYSTADGPYCTHATMASESYCIGTGPTSKESYLLMEEIIQIAKATNTTAIHPGFGFLSENVTFAQMVYNNHLIWIGPPIQAMMDMSSKSRAKQIMAQHNIPITPGYDPYNNNNNNIGNNTATNDVDDITMNEQLYHHAIHHVGFPLIIKAVLGGGGKGMRLVHHATEFQQALLSCQNEAYQSFHDKRVLLERYLIHPKHIEVQILGDIYGNIVHLYERDCSIQRRHQKVLEEAPSLLSENVRKYITNLGVRAASAVNYVNAGTVEFLIDTNPLSKSKSNPFGKQEEDENNEYGNIYFCEMNTRLQVEHSITEQITGLDIVEWQLRIAAGEPLPIPNQENIPSSNGHSIEARIYAETPIKQFLPSPGTVWFHEPPAIPNMGTDTKTGIRVDTGIRTNQSVSVYYDPMIAKLICHGRTRKDAIQKLHTALQKYKISGVSTNIDFLLQCIQQPLFQTNDKYDITTGFLELYGESILQNCTDIQQARAQHPVGRVAAIITLLLQLESRITPNGSKAATGMNHNNDATVALNKRPWSSHWGSWRIGGPSARVRRKFTIVLPPPDNDKMVIVTCISNFDGSFDLHWTDNARSVNSNENEKTINEVSFLNVTGTLDENGMMDLLLDRSHRIKLTSVMKKNDITGIIQIRMWPEMSIGGGSSHNNDFYWEVDIIDPVHAMIHAGDDDNKSIRAGTTSNGVIVAPMPGKISRINYKVGDVVKSGDIVMVMEAMKMEHPCSSPCDGIISEIKYEINMVVPDSAVLFVVSPQKISREDTTVPIMNEIIMNEIKH